MDRGMQMGEGGRVEPVASLPGPSDLKELREKIVLVDALIHADDCESKDVHSTRCKASGDVLGLFDALFPAALAAPEAASAEGSQPPFPTLDRTMRVLLSYLDGGPANAPYDEYRALETAIAEWMGRSPSHPSPRCAKCELSAWDWMDGKRICHYCRTPFPSSGPSQDSAGADPLLEAFAKAAGFIPPTDGDGFWGHPELGPVSADALDAVCLEWIKMLADRPSQDSQEVREAAQHLIFIQDRLDEMTGLKREELNHVTIADLLSEKDKAIKAVRAALLSQSPKGTAGARCPHAWEMEVDGYYRCYLCKERTLDPEEGESGPSAPKTGLRGAPRLDADDVTAARMLAAQGWCHPSTAHKVMDADLCNAIALVFAPFIGLLREGFEHVVWCSGSADFGPDGQARVGWMKGPVQWLEKVNKAIPAEAKPEPLSAAKGPDLPSSSQPAPGDVGAAGGGEE